VPADPAAIPYPLIKRAFDKTVAAALLVLLSPLGALALGAMALDMVLVPADRGSWLYRERRVSRGREFDLLKLRVLRQGPLRGMRAAGSGHARLLEKDAANLTWAGRHVLKRWYLDELPQLVNVLRGDISLVGPRPWIPAMVRYQLDRGYDYRLHVMAGWTGPAQVRKGFPFKDDDFTLDLEYVEASRGNSRQLLRRDVGLLAETARTLARGGGLQD
jgi:lipopolysaccharide/colanic/teichoic acid biosynthesis glycosyltransferase